MVSLFPFYLAIGCLAGLMSGLIGIGGGLVIVPLMALLLSPDSFAGDAAMHYAVGTSVTCIAFTTLTSAYHHQQRGNVRWSIATQLLPGILLGALLGSWIATGAAGDTLKLMFGALVTVIAIKMFLPAKEGAGRALPPTLGLTLCGFAVSLLGSMLGLGGGLMMVPLLVFFSVEMKHAVGTSSFCSCITAAVAMLSYLLLDHAHPGNTLPWSSGVIYWPAVAGILITSLITAPLGVKLTDILPAETIRKIFAVFLLLAGQEMIWSP